jgi:hypothetical protein
LEKPLRQLRGDCESLKKAGWHLMAQTKKTRSR